MQQQLTPAGHEAVHGLAQRYGVSVDAVATLLAAVNAGGGTMAQFYHPELGGGGQWMRGGMTMVGDMFNSRLQSTVSGLCSELSALLGSTQVYAPLPPSRGGGGGGTWWPGELGSPSASGGQNDTRYAVFPDQRRLAINRNGDITIYDTLDHQIGGVQQQQGGSYGSLSFSSQFGTFSVDSLPRLNPARAQEPPPAPPPQPPPSPTQGFATWPNDASPPSANLPAQEIFNAIERLAHLRDKGILSEEEFRTKKAELLSRL
jgi:hypothetical protein